MKNTEEFFASDADIHLGSSNFLPINSSILYDGYVLGKDHFCRTIDHFMKICLDHPDTSYVSGGFYSNWFDGTIKMSNETWHIEPTRKYGVDLVNLGPSIIYNALDVDMTKYDSTNAFRSKRFVMNEDEDSASSFCGLDKNKQREQMQKETDRLADDMDFKSRYTRSKRQTTNNNNNERERTCCYIYIRVDPTLWDVVYKNEGLNVRRLFFFVDDFHLYMLLNRKKNQLFMLLSHFFIEQSQQQMLFIVH